MSFDRRRLCGDEMLREQLDVLAALAQRRHVDVDDVEPVKEIGPKRALRGRAFQIAVARGQKPHVRVKHARRAQRPHLLFLDYAQ